MTVSNPESFWNEAQYQRVCAECGAAGPFDAHHVVEKQRLRQLGIPLELRYDTRNALRLCDERNDKNCHGGQTSKMRKVKLENLTDDNLAYADEVLGAAAPGYLRRHYDGDDPRVRAMEEAAAA